VLKIYFFRGGPPGYLNFWFGRFFPAPRAKNPHSTGSASTMLPQAKSAASGTLWVMQNNATA
jgi:hypothetical protein